MTPDAGFEQPPPGEILVVEDTVSSLRLLSDILTEAGHRVRPAGTGELALRSVEAKHPDLVLLDLKLPGIDGLEVCRRLKGDPATRNIPVIFISAIGDVELKVQALRAGAADYTTKPIDASEVLARVETHLQRSRMQRELEAQAEELRGHRERLENLVESRTEDLRVSESRFRSLFEASEEGILVMDAASGRILDVNPTGERMHGYSREELLALEFTELCDEPEANKNLIRMILAGSGASNPECHLRNKDGSVFPAEMSTGSFSHQGKEIAFVMLRDITERVSARREREMQANLLQILNTETDLHGLMRDALSFLREVSGCEAVGIRLQDADNFPYFETRGFPEQFVVAETNLCVTDLDGQLRRDECGNPVLECMCGNIIRGRFDPSRPFFTEFGSFVSNCTTELLASTSEEDRQARTRNRCNAEGYESVLLVPLRTQGETFGLLQLNDHRTGQFPPELVRQVEQLAGSVAGALAERRALAALQEEKKIIEQYLENLSALFYVFDEERFVRWNSEWKRVTGYSDEELAVRYGPDFCEGEEKALLVEKMREVFREGQATAEVHLLTKDGRRIPYLLSGARVSIRGKEHLVGMGLDITERRRAEALVTASLREKEVLLREIHHRVKNNMQVIVSLLRMHARDLQDDRILTVFNECRDRVNAMSLVHEVLYESEDVGCVDLETYLRRLCRHLDRAYGVREEERIEVTAGECGVVLGVDQSIAVGLVISELITNALKHAFAEGEGGRVCVHLSAGEGGEVRLVVQDDGKGLPAEVDISSSPSLGLRLVHATVTRELNGSLEVGQGAGTRLTIRFQGKSTS
jgi:PAS domain S-box-containing protein